MRSSDLNARPRTTAISSTLKYSGETNLYATVALAPSLWATAAGCATSPTGHAAATAATDGSAVTACTIAVRLVSFAILTMTVSEIRILGSTVVAASALRKNTAAQISRSADTLTCSLIRASRARPGCASLTTSPLIVGINSMRVACSAGKSPKQTVEMAAPTMRNSTTRQSASGSTIWISPISGGQLVIIALTNVWSTTREIANPAAAAINA